MSNYLKSIVWTLLFMFIAACGNSGQESLGSNSLVTHKPVKNTDTGAITYVAPIARDYVITADPTKNEIQFFATFRADNENGPSVRLENPSKITFEDHDAQETSISKGGAALMGLFLSPLFWFASGTSYHSSYATSDFTKPQHVSWVKPDGKVITQTFSLPKCEIESVNQSFEFNKPFKVIFSEISEVTQVLAGLHTSEGKTVSRAYLTPAQVKNLIEDRHTEFVFKAPSQKLSPQAALQVHFECDFDRKIPDDETLGTRVSAKTLSHAFKVDLTR